MCYDEIPVYHGNKIIATVPFEPNLNLIDEPAYVNGSENMGLARIPEGTYKGRLVIMFQNELYPMCNKAMFISDEKAYELCVNRGKYNVIHKFNIHPTY